LQQDHTAAIEEVQRLKIEILRRGGVPRLANQALGSGLDAEALAEDEQETQEDAYHAHLIQNNWRDSDTMELCSSKSTPRIFRPVTESRSPLEPEPEFTGGYMAQVVNEDGVARGAWIPMYRGLWARQTLALEHLKEKIDRGDYIVPWKTGQSGKKKIGRQSVRGWIFWLRLQARALLLGMFKAESKRKLSSLLPISSDGFPTVRESQSQHDIISLRPPPKAMSFPHTTSDIIMEHRSQLFGGKRHPGQRSAPPLVIPDRRGSVLACVVPASASINSDGSSPQQAYTLESQTLDTFGRYHRDCVAIKCTKSPAVVTPTSASSSEFQEIPFSGRVNLASRSTISPACKAGCLHYMSREASIRRTKHPQAASRVLKEKTLLNPISVGSFRTAGAVLDFTGAATTPSYQERILPSRTSTNRSNRKTTNFHSGNGEKIKNGRQTNIQPSNLGVSTPQKPAIQLPLAHSSLIQPQKTQRLVPQKRHQADFALPWNPDTSGPAKHTAPRRMITVVSSASPQEYLNTLQVIGLPPLERLSAIPEPLRSPVKDVEESVAALNGTIYSSSNEEGERRGSWTAEDESSFATSHIATTDKRAMNVIDDRYNLPSKVTTSNEPGVLPLGIKDSKSSESISTLNALDYYRNESATNPFRTFTEGDLNLREAF
jgi:hypothetical protein